MANIKIFMSKVNFRLSSCDYALLLFIRNNFSKHNNSQICLYELT